MKLREKFLPPVALLAAILGFFFLMRQLRPALSRAATGASAPYGRFTRLLPERLSSFARTLETNAAREAEITALRTENNRLRTEQLSLEGLRTENTRLRRALRITEKNPSLICAEVLSKQPANGWWNMIRIDKGARDGISPHCVVLAPEGLVGRVISVSARTADVLLLTDANSRVSCTVEGFEKGARGILSGGGVSRSGEALELFHVIEPLAVEYLPKDARLRTGARVVTSGLGGFFPAGIPIGEVREAARNSTELFQRAIVAPYVDFSSLRSVFVRIERKKAAAAEAEKEEPQS